MALICLVPFLMVLAGSFSSEAAITKNGFSLLPQDFSLEAYRTVFKEPMVVVRAYATTIGLTICGTLLGLAIQTMTAYVMTQMAAVDAALSTYCDPLINGLVDDVMQSLDDFRGAMESADIRDIIAELEKQAAEYVASKQGA